MVKKDITTNPQLQTNPFSGKQLNAILNQNPRGPY